MSLFATAPTETHLVEFNAGKCIIEGSWVKPDTRKGKLYMDQGDDQLLHLYWKERKNQSTPEDNMIIFPDEAEFTKVSQCTTGRVYVLKFKTSQETHFYWMQSKNDEKDQELVERVNELIRDPETNMNASSELDESTSHAELMRLLNGVENQAKAYCHKSQFDPRNLLQFLNSMNGSAETQDNDNDNEEEEELAPPAPTARATTAAAAEPVVTAPPTAPVAAPATESTPVQANANQQQSSEQLDQLRQILANIRPEEGSGAPIALTDVLNSQSLTPLLNDREFCATLFPFLPEDSERSPEEVRQIIRSPQFTQALQSLGAALQTGQLGPLLSQLGLHPSAGNSVDSFLIGIIEQAKQNKKNNNDDAMDED
ncbi:unnamed protein product [Mucor hiemalis]